jgi:class 3 adenylate cyclase
MSVGCGACGMETPPGARFCPGCGLPLAGTGIVAAAPLTIPGGGATVPAGPQQGSSRTTARPPADERRPVTILFADLVGSTALAEQFDPEDWKEIVAPVLARFEAIIEEHDGHVAQLLGDGLLAFFGAPVAHEDDPMRAVRAGLGIVDALALRRAGPLGGRPDLQVRVGINSGEVVVGGMGREGRREYLAVGDAVNVAARLQSAAAPMTVLVTEETYRRVEDAVDAVERGPLQLKGKTLPISAREIVQVRDRRSRGRAARHAAALTGREDELAALVAAVDDLGQRGGGIVRITGEPGIGKSRLVAEWHEALATVPADGTDHTGAGVVARAAGGSQWENATDWVVVACRTGGPELSRDLVTALVRELLGIAESLDADLVRHAFDARIAGLLAADAPWRAEAAAAHERAVGPTSDEAAALLAWLLDLPPTGSEREALAGLEGRPRQRRAGEALGLLLRMRSSERPLVLVLEDCHWLDPSSAELLAVATEGVAPLPICLCWTRRPDRAPAIERLESALEGLSGLRHLEISLAPLDPGAQEQLAERLLAGGIPNGLRRLVAERCEGNPLFVEELIAVLVDRGRLHRDATGAWTLTSTDTTEIPPGIHGLLVTRLDLLPAQSGGSS